MRSYAASVARQDLCVRGKSPKRALKSKRKGQLRCHSAEIVIRSILPR